MRQQTVSWTTEAGPKSIKLVAGRTYIRPSGYRVHVEKPSPNRAWRLIGTVSEPTLCHKPSTVSGGGKSEISKSIGDAIIHGPVFTSDFKRDFDLLEELVARDYSGRFRDPAQHNWTGGPILSSERSLLR